MYNCKISFQGGRQIFCNGGTLLRVPKGQALQVGLRVSSHQKIIFKFGGSEMLFSALVMRYVSEKSTLNMKMAINKLLQVTIIKITESKDNKSIQRLDVSGLTGPGGTAAPLPSCQLQLWFPRSNYQNSFRRPQQRKGAH